MILYNTTSNWLGGLSRTSWCGSHPVLQASHRGRGSSIHYHQESHHTDILSNCIVVQSVVDPFPWIVEHDAFGAIKQGGQPLHTLSQIFLSISRRPVDELGVLYPQHENRRGNHRVSMHDVGRRVDRCIQKHHTMPANIMDFLGCHMWLQQFKI